MNYASLEQLRDGIWMSGKYEGKKKNGEPSKVVVLMNKEPDMTALSHDRYYIVNV